MAMLKVESPYSKLRGQYIAKNPDAISFNDQIKEDDKKFYDAISSLKELSSARVKETSQSMHSPTSSMSLVDRQCSIDESANQLMNLGFESNIWLNMNISDWNRTHDSQALAPLDQANESRIVISMLSSSERVSVIINEVNGYVGPFDETYGGQINDFNKSLKTCLVDLKPIFEGVEPSLTIINNLLINDSPIMARH